MRSAAPDVPDVVDVVFGLPRGILPRNPEDAVRTAVLGLISWFGDEPLAGMHPLKGWEDESGRLHLARGASLTLRLPQARAQQAMALSGAALSLEGIVLRLGEAAVRRLRPVRSLHARCVVLGGALEPGFSELLAAELESLGIRGALVTGRPREIEADGRRLVGYAALVSGLNDAASLRLQSLGVGDYRRLGCGVFVPHKSTASVLQED